MSDFTGWTLDPSRNEYYYYSQAERAYIYQNGGRIYLDATRSSGEARDSALSPRTRTTEHEVVDAENPEGDDDDDDDDDDDSDADHDEDKDEDEDEDDGGDGDDDPSDALAEGVERIDLGGQVYVRGVEAQDPSLPAGVKVKGRLKGSFEKKVYEKLFPQYKIRRPGAHFFVRGKVFKALWAEMAGNSNESVTTTPDSKFGEDIATKIRWFVVVREGANFCTCLPIATYSRKGVGKKGIIKENHAIAYSTKDPPKPRSSELPRLGENPMMPEIRVKAKRKGDKLDRMSRIDFSRMYTVEHNVKVYDFGDVHRDYLDKLIQHWVRVNFRDLTSVSSLYMAEKKKKKPKSDKRYSKQSDHDGSDDNDDDEETSSSEGSEEKAQTGSYGSGHASGYNTGYTTAGYVPSNTSSYPTTTSGYGSGMGYSTSNTSYGIQPGGQGGGGGGYGGQTTGYSGYQDNSGYAPQYPSSRPGKDSSSRDTRDRKGRSSSSKEKRRK